MKKSLIAASASAVALAAMPIVGVFADDIRTQTDTLEITVPAGCSFGYENAQASIDITGVDHSDGEATIHGTWTLQGATTADPADPEYDTLSAIMAPGTESDDLGSTTLGVYCNNELGYTITTTGAGNLTDSGVTGNIPIAYNFGDDHTGWSYKVAAKTASGWTQRGEVKNNHTNWANASQYVDAGTSTTYPIANDLIAGSPASSSKTTLNTGDYFIITYGAGVDQTAAAGTYSGNITYTLAPITSN